LTRKWYNGNIEIDEKTTRGGKHFMNEIKELTQELVINFKIVELLKEKDWSQRRLSRTTGIRQATINDMTTNSITMIGMDNLAKICQALECEITDVIELVPMEEADKRFTKDEKRIQARLNATVRDNEAVDEE
jgi:putative transcriptional regulator